MIEKKCVNCEWYYGLQNTNEKNNFFCIKNQKSFPKKKKWRCHHFQPNLKGFFEKCMK